MRTRTQRTPYGVVTLTSWWKRDRYWLIAAGSHHAVRWLVPAAKQSSIVMRNAKTARWRFCPAPTAITNLRDLEGACSQWQSLWNERLQEVVDPDPMGHHSDDGLPATFGDAIGALVRQAVDRWAATTAEKNRHYLRWWLDVLPGETPLIAITPDMILQARTQISLSRSAVTVNCATSLLKQVLRHAHEEGWLPGMPWRAISPLRTVERTASWWNADQVPIALAVARADRHCARQAELMLALAIYLGLRKGELVELRWQDLDLDRLDPHRGTPAPVCRIRCDEDWRPKSGKGRAIPISAELATILARHRRGEGYVLEAQKPMPRSQTVKGARRYRFHVDKIWRRVREAAVARGLPAIRFHDLRHSFASNLLNRGIPAEKVAAWLGHATTELVHRRYGHLLAYDDDINRLQFESGHADQVREYGASPRIIRFTYS